MEKVSVIVPVYNVEIYLRRCVDSILNQTHTNLQIILVDDGSTDGSGKICDEYAKKDDRVQVIHKKNGGVSDARNQGIKEAIGEYIIFIDSDDYIDQTMLEILYTRAVEAGADVSACGAYNVYAGGKKAQYDKLEEFTCTASEAFEYILIGKKMTGSLCNKLVRTEFIKQIQFSVDKIYEDAFYITDLMQKIQTVTVTTKPLYYYYHRSGSYTTSPFQKRDMDVIEVYKRNLAIVQKMFPEIVDAAKFRLDWAYFTVLDRMLLLEQYRKVEGFKEVVRYLRKNIISILKSSYFYKGRKIGALALFLNVRIYRVLVKYNHQKIKKAM